MEPQLTTSWTPTTGAANGTERKALETDASTADFQHGSSLPVPTDVPARIGKFEIRQVLGRGGQAQALLAHDPDLHREVVLKLYHSARDADRQNQVLNEGRSLARVRSPYVAQCHGVDRHQGVPYLIIEYVRGETLAQRLKTRRPTLAESLEIAGRIADGLAAVHAVGLLHRDLKPSNVLIGDDGSPRIVDFGLAASPENGELESGQISGTPSYMAPEQARGEADRLDPRTDVFGLGAVLYEMLTGRPPYVATESQSLWEQARDGRIVPPSQVVSDLPAAVNDLCLRCLAVDPAQRFASVVELRDAIRALHDRQTRRGREFALRIGRFQIRLMIGTAAAALLFAVLWNRPQEIPRETAFNPPRTFEAPLAAPAPIEPPPATGGGLRRGAAEPAAPPLAESAKSFPAPAPFGLRDAETAARRMMADAKSVDRLTVGVRVEPVDATTLENGTLVFRAGQPLRFRICAEQDCQIELWRVTANGRQQLFPNEFDAAVLVRAGESRLVPPADHADQWRAESTAADEQLLLYVSPADPDANAFAKRAENRDRKATTIRLRVVAGPVDGR